MKAIFLDRDGVINRKLPGDYVKRWDEFEFLPGVQGAIRLLNEAGYLVLIVTNQRGIARGLMTLEDVRAVHSKMREELQMRGARVDGIYVCTHEAGKCECRKPLPGLLLQAQGEYSIDRATSWMVGDSESDIQAGQAYGVRTIFIGDAPTAADKRCKDLAEAAEWIVGGNT